jgi:hypothetical protein
MPFSDRNPADPERAIPYEIADYIELLDWSGRAIVRGKRGSIPETLPPILERLKVNPERYVRFVRNAGKHRFRLFIGPVYSMRALAKRFGKNFLKAQTAAAQLFSPG